MSAQVVKGKPDVRCSKMETSCWQEGGPTSINDPVTATWVGVRIKKHGNIPFMGGRHYPVVSSVPTILRPWVQIPSTPSTLFSICIEIVTRKERKINKKRPGLAHFFLKKVMLTPIQAERPRYPVNVVYKWPIKSESSLSLTLRP